VVVVSDDGAPVKTDSETITVSAIETNDPPVLAGIGPKSVDEGVALGFTATATDPDVPANNLNFTLSGTVPAGASITPGGVFSWTPAEAQDGVHTFNVVVSDDGIPVKTDSEAITVTVGEVNSAPTVTNPGDRTDSIGAVVSLSISATDPDLPANTLSYSDGGTLPPGLSINPATGVITGSPTALGTSAVTITVTDDGLPINLSDFDTFDWTIVAPAIVINEVLYQERALVLEEFVELHNPSAAPVSLSGWRLTGHNITVPDAVDYDFVIPATDVLGTASVLAPGEYAVIWLQTWDGAGRDAAAAALQYSRGSALFVLDDTGDEVWLWDGLNNPVDFVDWGDRSGGFGDFGTPPAPALWDGLYSEANRVAGAAGRSLALTPNGSDNNHSANWEPTATGAAGLRAEAAGAPTTVVADLTTREASPGVHNSDPYEKSPFAGQTVINEVGYNISNDEEFVEFFNAGGTPLDLEGWRIADGNALLVDHEGGGGRFDFTFPAGPSLPAGGTAVVWVQASNPLNQAPDSVDLEFWAGDPNAALAGGDDLWLFDDDFGLVDYVAWGFGGNINDPPAPLASWWDDSNQVALGLAGGGQSISLTANGVDSDDSNCWEVTTAATSGCGPATVDNHDGPLRVASPGDDNNVATADVSVAKTSSDATPNSGETITYTITVTNNSASNAVGGVAVTDALPVPDVFYLFDDSGGDYSTATDVWTLGAPLGAGASASLNITVRVDAVAGATVANSASITAAGAPDPDASNNSDTATITVNRPPDAADDSASTLQGIPVPIDALGNDTDPDGDTVTIKSYDAASTAGGSIALYDNGTPGDPTDDVLIYTPALGFSGADSFGYVGTDGKGGDDPAIVSITVTATTAGPLFLETDGSTSNNVLLPLTTALAASNAGPPVPDWNDGGDGRQGRTLQRSGNGLDEGNQDKFQTWAIAGPVTLSGPVRLDIYSAAKDFIATTNGKLLARLADCLATAPIRSNVADGCTEIATAQVTAAPWAPSGSWELKALDFGSPAATVTAGRELRLKLVVDDVASTDHLMMAYDTLATPSALVRL
jgi:uncharacterized repeat protein (TIGR01451 family)